mmetsp:Transcript_11440/g.15618  ORF Transcript_11440/g.15618 Transcript_11440/m.15618 type:complete len:301 (+) Transcript_11440:1-903(+)
MNILSNPLLMQKKKKKKIQLIPNKRQELISLLTQATEKNCTYQGECADALAEILFWSGRYKEGLKASRKALPKLKASQAAECALSAAHAAHEDKEEAIFFFDQAAKLFSQINRHDKAGDAAYTAAVLANDKGERASCAARFLKAATLDAADDQEQARLQFLLAKTLLFSGRHLDACIPARKAVLIKPPDDKIYFDRLDLLAESFALSQRFHDTIHVLKQALYLTRHTRIAWSTRDMDQARATLALATAFEEVSDFHSSQPLWTDAASAFSKLNKQQTAESCRQRADAAAKIIDRLDQQQS